MSNPSETFKHILCYTDGKVRNIGSFKERIMLERAIEQTERLEEENRLLKQNRIYKAGVADSEPLEPNPRERNNLLHEAKDV